MNTTNIYKKCPGCSAQWQSWEDFFTELTLKLNGYKADFEKLEYGLFFFTHMVQHCHSTVVMEAQPFLDLFSGVRYTQNKTLSQECPHYCLDQKILELCMVACERAFVQEVIQIIVTKQNRK